MPKKLANLILIYLLLPSISRSQSAFTFLKDDSILKRQYQDVSVQKKQATFAAVGKTYAKQYNKIYQTQFEEIDKIWSTSRSITDPVVANYLQKLVDKIKQASRLTKDSDARVIFSRDWWPNAFSMGDGTIVINAGIMLYLESEAELAFIIAHELAHYHLEHTPKAIKKYVETMNSEEVQQELKRVSKEKYGVNRQLEALAKGLAFDSRRHGRDHETEADSYAFHLVKNSGFTVDGIRTALLLLDKIDSTALFPPLVLEKVFSFEGVPFKRKWIQEESSIFSQVKTTSNFTKKERDSLKTHPDCSKRIAQLEDSIKAHPEGKSFLVNEAVFKNIKEDFFAEIMEQCYKENELSRHLYYALVRLQEKENDPLAIYSIARTLNKLYLLQKEHKLGTTIEKESIQHTADYNLLLRMLSRIRLDEIADLNDNFCKKHTAIMQPYPAFAAEIQQLKQIKNH